MATEAAEQSSPPLVELLVREGCGSCKRLAASLPPVAHAHGAECHIVDVDEDPELAAEFGDRLPVVLVAGEEIACWECEPEELAQALLNL